MQMKASIYSHVSLIENAPLYQIEHRFQSASTSGSKSKSLIKSTLSSLFLLFLTCHCIKAQTVLLLGSSHQMYPGKSEEVDELLSLLEAFSPIEIMIESIPTYDTSSLQTVRNDRIQLAKQLSKTGHFFSSSYVLEKQLAQDTTNLLLRSQLANHFYIENDFWNAYYHWYILSQQINNGKAIDSMLQESYVLNNIHARVYNREQTSEYGQIVYPLAHKLGITRLTNIDYRADEHEFLALQRRLLTNALISFRLSLLFSYSRLQNSHKKALKAMDLIETINSESYQTRIVQSFDLLWKGDHENRNRFKLLWFKRNEIIAKRIAQVIKPNQNYLVIIGAAHVPYIKEFLRTLAPDTRIETVSFRESSN